jgi:16S rRNA (cytidine1402-2'-O)-methyltransferase
VASAVALAGVEAPGFMFGGFLPARPAAARRAALTRLLEAAGSVGMPLVLYEAPHRVRTLVSALAESAPAARVAVMRELTKRHEEVVMGTASEVAGSGFPARGEFTIVISDLPAPGEHGGAAVDGASIAAAGRAAGLPDRTIVEMLRAAGLSRREAYALVSQR